MSLEFCLLVRKTCLSHTADNLNIYLIVVLSESFIENHLFSGGVEPVAASRTDAGAASRRRDADDAASVGTDDAVERRVQGRIQQ